MSIEAMKQVLDALENLWGATPQGIVGAITSLRQAIEGAEEQEPHCYMDEYGHVEGEMKRYMEEQGGWFPVYTTPPKREWVGLTEEEYKNIRYGSDESGELYVSYGEYDEGYECGSEIEIYVDDFAKAIEAKLREKNTYTTPPQRTWVGLTVREIEWCFYDANDARIVAARNIEAKLREKNSC